MSHQQDKNDATEINNLALKEEVLKLHSHFRKYSLNIDL